MTDPTASSAPSPAVPASSAGTAFADAPVVDASAAGATVAAASPSVAVTGMAGGSGAAGAATVTSGAAYTVPRPAPAPTTVQPIGGSWFGTVMLTVASVALVLSGLLWQRLDKIQQELARRAADVVEESEKSRDAAEQALTLSQELQAKLSVAEVKLSEVTLQRSQLEELMLSLSRSRDDTLVLDIESGLRLAMQQAELTGSTQPILSALQAADRRIGKAAQPRLNPVQRAIARDIERVRAAQVADLPLLASRLDDLARAVDTWVLANAEPRKRAAAVPVSPVAPVAPKGAKERAPGVAVPGGAQPSAVPADARPKAEDAPEVAALPKVAVAAGADGTPSTGTAAGPDAGSSPTAQSGSSGEKEAAAVEAVAPADTKGPTALSGTPAKKSDKVAKRPRQDEAQPNDLEARWTQLRGWWAQAWERVWGNVTLTTQDLVRVSRIDEPEAALVSPEQANFLRENLKLRLLSARLSLLSRQVTAARADMQAVKASLTRYFDAQAQGNRQAQQTLTDVLQASRSLDLPRPDETLAALAKAAGGR